MTNLKPQHLLFTAVCLACFAGSFASAQLPYDLENLETARSAAVSGGSNQSTSLAPQGPTKGQTQTQSVSQTQLISSEDLSSRKTQIEGVFSLNGKTLKDEAELEKQDTLLTSALFSLDHRFTSVLSAELDFILQFESGNTRSAYREITLDNGVFVDQAVMRIEPTSFLKLDMGALNQRSLQNSLLISARALPGIAQEVFALNKNLRLGVRAQQTLLTNESFATNTVEDEETPYFLTETAFLDFTGSPYFTVKSRLTHFRFSNLTTTQAGDSRYLGNTVTALNDVNASFTYGFTGLEGGLDLQIGASSVLGLNAGFGLLRNTAAPLGRDKGQIYYLEAPVRFHSNLHLTPRAEYFVNQSDSSPSVFNSETYGNNNRQGNAGNLSLNFPESGFKVSAQYVNANTIEKLPYQAPYELFMIRLETSYEIL